PLARAVAAVIARTEGRIDAEVVVEEARGGRYPRHDPRTVLGGSRHQVAAGILFQEVVDGLDRSYVPLRERGQPLLAPADRRAECDPVMPDLPLAPQVLQGGEALVGVDRVHPRIVKLVEVDAVGAKPPQARLERAHDEGPVPAW